MYMCVFPIIFIHSSVDRHLDCFHVLAIVNSERKGFEGLQNQQQDKL